MAGVGDLGELDAVPGQGRQVGQLIVLLAVHEHRGQRQGEEAGQQVAVIGQLDHRIEDRLHGLGADLVRQAGGEETTGVVARATDAIGEVGEELLRVAVRPAVSSSATSAPAAGSLARALDGWSPAAVQSARRVDPWPAVAFADLLDVPRPPLEPGDPLPPLWHWFTMVEHSAHAERGADGHPAQGHFLPPIPHRRRMFAGGRYRQHAPITIGAELACRSTVADVAVKRGRSGELAFVTVRHELSVAGTPVGVEEQDIVYRSQPDGAPRSQPTTAAQKPKSTLADWQLTLPTDPVRLFRFSALTYNGHRIHYDQPYATGVEGYPDLVVHGPLLALLALELPRRNAPTQMVTEFAYRLVRPAFVGAVIEATGNRRGPDLELAVGAELAGPSLTATAALGPALPTSHHPKEQP